MHLIAEAGVNWNTIEEAKEMILQSKLAHASCTKFQLFDDSVIRNSDLYGVLKERILTKEAAKELFDYGEHIKQPVFFSCMFEEAVDWCEEIGVERYKIRFVDRYNYDLIYKVLSTHKEVLMSIDWDYRAIEFMHNPRIKFLYCVPKYPANEKDYKLNNPMFEYFSGISDHTKSLEVARKSLKLKSDIIIEKHCMLSGTHPIEEPWSVTFEELKSLYAFEPKK